jgi:DNA mismatch repair ATPase MutL
MKSSLVLDPKDVDPNVHPTKREVHFLNEEAITQTIADYMQTALTKESTSRTFQTQVKPIQNRWNIFDLPVDSSYWWNIGYIYPTKTKQAA